MAVISGTPVAQFDFTLKAGSDTTISCTWLNDNDQPLDLTGYLMELSIRAFVGSPVVLLTLSSQTTEGSRIVLGGVSGIFDLVFAHADTAALKASGVYTSARPGFSSLPVLKVGVYDLQFTNPNGDIGYLFEGLITMDPQVTA